MAMTNKLGARRELEGHQSELGWPSRMHQLMLRLMLRFSQSWLRQGLVPFGKRLVWDRVCAPYLIWRDWELITRVKAGFRVHAPPQRIFGGPSPFFRGVGAELDRVFRTPGEAR